MKPLAVTFGILVLAGCTSSTPSTGETYTDSASPTVVETASPTPTPTSAESVITTAGLGPLVIGQPVPSGNGIVEWVADACLPGSDKQFGEWIGDTTDPEAPGVVAHTDGENGVLDQLLVSSPTITTESGAHVGMTVADLTAIFPSAELIERDDVDLLVVSDKNGQVAFEVATDRGADTWDIVLPGVNVIDTVVLIQVIPADRDVVPWSMNGYGFTICGVTH